MCLGRGNRQPLRPGPNLAALARILDEHSPWNPGADLHHLEPGPASHTPRLRNRRLADILCQRWHSPLFWPAFMDYTGPCDHVQRWFLGARQSPAPPCPHHRHGNPPGGCRRPTAPLARCATVPATPNLSPSGLLRVFPLLISLLAVCHREVLRLRERRVHTYDFLLISRDGTTYAHPFGLGVKFYTAYSDGTCLITGQLKGEGYNRPPVTKPTSPARSPRLGRCTAKRWKRANPPGPGRSTRQVSAPMPVFPPSKIPAGVHAANRARLEIRRLLANLRAWLEFAPARNPDAFPFSYPSLPARGHPNRLEKLAAT
ncbi:hypothetical protein SBA3_1510010 [Candidatus Sulfopaludibacter sp. SbA3]|nr:hypothetical protein SBA3_1510010 [Candidatus Sulfopaludibacter sp. SbA3]